MSEVRATNKRRNRRVNILIIDDDELSRANARLMCEDLIQKIDSDDLNIESSLNMVDVPSIDAAIAALAEEPFQIIFLDKDLGKRTDGTQINGVDHIKELLAIQPFAKILIYTADISSREIARAMRDGATDYLMKSSDSEFADYREAAVKIALKLSYDELKKARTENNKGTGLYSNFVCSSPAMQRFEEKMLAMAESSRPVLFLGATGLGKGAAARRLNQLREKHLKQKDRPFVEENIGGMQDSLVQSILFGTEPGAYTDASRKTKPGLLDLANGGDIFLDEIGDTSLEIQKKILKVVEERQYMRVGGKIPIKTNARFIFATNKSLKDLVAKELFREDLYRRISAFEESIPRLEERKADLPDIIEGLIRNSLEDHPLKRIAIDDLPLDLLNYLTRDDIPGNIRGIENDVTRLIAYVICDSGGRPNFKEWRKILGIDPHSSGKRSLSVLELKHLTSLESNFLNSEFPGLKAAIAIFERKLLAEAAQKYTSFSEAALALRISKAGVHLKMKAANIKFQGGRV
jgi:DNA-binding NtrC family response regulator